MSCKASTRHEDGVLVIDFSGAITLGDGSVVLRDVIKEVLGKGERKLLLNLGDVNYIDSSGIGEMDSHRTFAEQKYHATIKLLHLTKKVHDLIQITRLYSNFEVFDDEKRAIASFK